MRVFGCFWLAGALLVPLAPARADLLEQQRKLEILALKVPENLDLARSREGKRFRVSYEPEEEGGNVPLRRMHAWKIEVRDPEGRPVGGATVKVEGTMPQHSHPLPTLPSVKELSAGDFRVSGLKFHMPGWWVVTFSVRSGKQFERFAFNLML